MAIICEKAESRRAAINGQGEDREKIWIVETDLGPPEALDDAAIPDIGDAWPGEADMLCIAVDARYSHKTGIKIYCEVTAQYSNYREEFLEEPGDMIVEIDMHASSQTVRYAKRATSPDGAGKHIYETGYEYTLTALDTIGQFGESGAPAYKPQYTLRVTKLLDDDMVYMLYQKMYSLIGTLNDKIWNGATKGRLLFLGGDIVKVRTSRWQAGLYFVWDAFRHTYPWYTVNQTTGVPSTDVIYSQVYEFGDFDDLDIDLTAQFPGGLFTT